MPIPFTCKCGKSYMLPDKQAGKEGRCKCGNAFTVPGKDTEDLSGMGMVLKGAIALMAAAALFGLAYWLAL